MSDHDRGDHDHGDHDRGRDSGGRDSRGHERAQERVQERTPDHGHDRGGHGGDDPPGESVAEVLPAVFAVGTLGVAATAAVLGYGSLAGVVAVVGWLLLTPLSAIIADTRFVRSRVGGTDASADRSRGEESASEDEAALEELKRRYARGEIDEAEFERRTAALLENESLDDVRERVSDARSRGDREPAGRRERERAGTSDREPEYET